MERWHLLDKGWVLRQIKICRIQTGYRCEVRAWELCQRMKSQSVDNAQGEEYERESYQQGDGSEARDSIEEFHYCIKRN